MIGRNDLKKLLDRLCGDEAMLLDEDQRLSTRDRKEIIDQVSVHSAYSNRIWINRLVAGWSN